MIKTKTFGQRINLGFTIMVALLAMAVGITIWKVQEIKMTTERLIELRKPTSDASLMMLNGINHSIAALRGFIILGQEISASPQNRKAGIPWGTKHRLYFPMLQERFKEERAQAWEKEIRASLFLMEKFSSDWTEAENLKRLRIVKENLKIFEEYQKEIQQTAKTQQSPLTIKILFEQAMPTGLVIKRMLEEMVDSQHSLASKDSLELNRQIQILDIIEWILLFCGTGFGTFLGLNITRSITMPIIKTVQSANEIAAGNYNVTLDIGGSVEIESLGKAMNAMRGNLAKMTDDVSNTMLDLKKANDEQQQQLWISNSRAKLSRNMSGEEDTTSLAHNIITCLSNLLDAGTGAMYVVGEHQQLKLVASYAFTDRENNFNEFKLGEGLVGQAALEKTTIVFSDVPQNFARINYGMGEVLPAYYLITPILYEDVVKGVLALGSVKEFTLVQKTFVDQIKNDIGIALNGAQSHEKIEILLKETREQTAALQDSQGKLKVQQEELQATNQELEEQTRSLQESEEKLKVQQEELQVTNEELEEKTESLEKQKDEIIQKNFEVAKSKEEIEIKAKELEETNRYKSEFLANMSHELRTPLNSLLLLATMLQDNEEDNLSDDQMESIGIIHSSGSDLLLLINEILDLSKVESGKMSVHIEDVVFMDFIKGIEQQFKPIADKKELNLNIVLADDIPKSMTMDQQKVEQILKNLLSNAFKFTEKGAVTVTIARPGMEMKFKDHKLTALPAIAFSVSDDGIGIPEEKCGMVFEAFQQVDGTTSRKYGGTGLGLSISRELAKLLGGEIVLRSAENEGSTFTLCLPEVFREIKDFQKENLDRKGSSFFPNKNEIVQTIKQKTERISKYESISFQDDRENISIGDKTILIIEDDHKFAKVLFDISHKKGFKGLVALDGEAGLKLAAEYQPSAIVLDIMLPGIDGWVVMDRLKDDSRTRHIPVHFMSALEEEKNSLNKGSIGYLSKPISKDQLDTAFEQMEGFIAKDIKDLLIVIPDEDIRGRIINLITNQSINIISVGTGREAYACIKSQDFDCMIVDGEISDVSVLELLKEIQEVEPCITVPVIVYASKELSREEDRQLKQYAKSIIVRGEKSKERLLDETVLFLHCVESNFSENQKRMIRQVHDKESILMDKKILVVDDDMRNTFALSKALRAKSMTVILAENGKIAVEMLNHDLDIDIVLMDIMMPVMDGYDAIREIRKGDRFKKLPILALTAKAMIGDREKCIEAGANDYLSKPVDVEKLLSMLRVWLYQ